MTTALPRASKRFPALAHLPNCRGAPGFPRSRRARFLARLALGIALISGCGGPTPRNAVRIVVDTLRWDRVGAYGHDRDTSPVMDALAAEGVRFEYAYASAPWTMPSVASLITGLYPTGHGVMTAMTGMSKDVHTLPEILRERGFRTGGVVSNHLIRSRLGRGFAQGYDIYRGSEAGGHDHISTGGVTDQAIEMVRDFARTDAPFFLFVHYFDPHFNYRRHPAVGFAPPRVGRLDGRQNIHQLRNLLQELSEAEIDFLLDLYDEEIFFTDAGIGRLLEAVREVGAYDSTIIVLTSDHGEEFRDHGWLGHTRTLYQELIRVPLIISAPGYRGKPRVVPDRVSLVSITPTLLDLLSIEREGLSFHEPSLEGPMSGCGGDAPDFVLTEVGFLPPGIPRGVKRAFKKAIVGERYKLIRDEETGKVELYDLEADPGERNNLADAQPALRNQLLRELDGRLRRARQGATPPDLRHLSDDEIESLRALGYVDS